MSASPPGPHPGTAQRRLAARLSATGAPHAEVAAAVLVARGRRSEARADLARLLGVSVEYLRSVESGRRAASHLPRRLAELDPGVDWARTGMRARDDPADPASRHPSGWARAPDSTGTHAGGGARMPPWETSASSIG